MTTPISLIELKTRARQLGLSSLGVIPAQPARRLQAYLDWLDRGYHGEMHYLGRPDRVARRLDLQQILPGARSLIVVTLDYDHVGPGAHVLHDPTRGRISSYAWGLDYHDTLLPKLESLAQFVRASQGESSHRAYVDTGAILERDHGELAGLGFVGKNTMLIAPRRGSYFFLGEILTTARIQGADEAGKATNRSDPGRGSSSIQCGTCTRCLTACPTEAFPAPYVLDARRCISYLTIEFAGDIPLDLRPQMGNWVFGCDICQAVCPFDRFAPIRSEPTVAAESAAPRLTDWLAWDQDEFLRRFRGTPLQRTGRDRVVRNACVAAGNSRDPALIPVLKHVASHDPSDLVRRHARWGWDVLTTSYP